MPPPQQMFVCGTIISIAVTIIALTISRPAHAEEKEKSKKEKDEEEFKQWLVRGGYDSSDFRPEPSRTRMLGSETTKNTRMFQACTSGELKICRFLAARGAINDIRTRNIRGISPLHSACEHGHLHVVTWLLQMGVSDVTSKSFDGSSPLSSACRRGHIEIVRWLLDDGRTASKLWEISSDGMNLLMHACSGHHIHLAQLLHTRGLDVRACDANGSTPLILACANGGNLELVKWLCEEGAIDDLTLPAKDGSTPMLHACASGNLDLVQWLYQAGANDLTVESQDGLTLMASACLARNVELMKWLFLAGAPLMSTRFNVFGNACLDGNLDMAKWLLEVQGSYEVHRAEPDGKPPIHCASSAGELEMVKWLLREGAGDQVRLKDKEGMTPMYHACACGHLEVAKWLYGGEAHRDVIRADKYGRTPFLVACTNGYLEVAKWLFGTEAHRDLRRADVDGRTPFLEACANGSFDLAKWLFGTEARRDLRRVDIVGGTPFLEACANGSLDLAKWLFGTEAHLDLRRADKNCRTPMHFACANGHLEVAQWLFGVGAHEDVNAKDFNGETPLQCASAGGFVDVVEWLVEVDEYMDQDQIISGLAGCSGDPPVELSKWLVQYGIDRERPEFVVSIILLSWKEEGFMIPSLFLTLLDLVPASQITQVLQRAVMEACSRGWLELLQFLWQKLPSAIFHASGERFNGYTPLLKAVENAKYNVAVWLLKTCSSTQVAIHYNGVSEAMVASIQMSWLSHTAGVEGDLDAFQALLSALANGRSPLCQHNLELPGFDAGSFYDESLASLEVPPVELSPLVVQASAWASVVGALTKAAMNGACAGGHLHVLRWIVSSGFVERDDINVGELLCHTSQTGSVDVCMWLHAEFGVQMTALHHYVAGICALTRACYLGHSAMLRWIFTTVLHGDASILPNLFTMLCASGHFELAASLLDTSQVSAAEHFRDSRWWENCSSLDDTKKLLSIAAARGVDLLAGSGANLLLRQSCVLGDVEIARWVVDHGGADVLTTDWPINRSPMEIACTGGNLALVQWLSSKGALNGTSFESAVNRAYGHVDVLKFLLERGSQANLQTLNVSSLLLKACDTGDPEIVKCIVDQGVDARSALKSISHDTVMYHSTLIGGIQWLYYHGLTEHIELNHETFNSIFRSRYHSGSDARDIERFRWLFVHGVLHDAVTGELDHSRLPRKTLMKEFRQDLIASLCRAVRDHSNLVCLLLPAIQSQPYPHMRCHLPLLSGYEQTLLPLIASFADVPCGRHLRYAKEVACYLCERNFDACHVQARESTLELERAEEAYALALEQVESARIVQHAAKSELERGEALLRQFSSRNPRFNSAPPGRSPLWHSNSN